MNKFYRISGFLLAGSLMACLPRSEIKQIQDNQAKILEKLEKIEKSGGRPTANARPRGPEPSKTYAVDVGESHVKGPKDAWVTIVEFSDFQCPFCNRVNPTMKKVEETFGDDVRIAFRHNALSFHKRAKPAAMASECAGEQGKFWEMHDKLFANQRALEDDQLAGYANEIGLNSGKWKSCYDGKKFSKKVDNDQRTALRFGARGTPAFFVNGRFLSGAQPFERFESLIKEELNKAKASGLSKSDYYAKAIVAKGEKKL